MIFILVACLVTFYFALFVSEATGLGIELEYPPEYQVSEFGIKCYSTVYFFFGLFLYQNSVNFRLNFICLAAFVKH